MPPKKSKAAKGRKPAKKDAPTSKADNEQHVDNAPAGTGAAQTASDPAAPTDQRKPAQPREQDDQQDNAQQHQGTATNSGPTTATGHDAGKTGANSSKAATKRKRPQSDAPASPSTTKGGKAPRRSGRGVAKTALDPVKTMRFLLSPEAQDFCRPKDETDDIIKYTGGGDDDDDARKDSASKSYKTYSTSVLLDDDQEGSMTPFEELLSAIVLSRPISHRLGLRTIRTVLNEPYVFTTPGRITTAGSETRHQALWDARTQHKTKTADGIGHLAEVVLERFAADGEDASLGKVWQEAGNDVKKVRTLLQTSIKGLGKTGLDIFFRRVQRHWPQLYPFADDRTLAALARLDLPSDSAQALQATIDQHWQELSDALPSSGAKVPSSGANAKSKKSKKNGGATKKVGDEEEGGEEKKMKRKAFVIILERAVGCDLEGNGDVVRDMLTD